MNLSPTKIDKTKIKIPKITFTDRALTELRLIIENDFTLAGKYFRLLISGKGCDGFTYSAGFTDLNEDDFLVNIENNSAEDLLIAIDPFAAFYLSDVSVDYVLDMENNNDGFVITNHLQKDYHGKFWKSAPTKTPPLTSDLGHA